MQNFPPFQWASHHPRVAAWIVLAVGMSGLVIYEGRDVGLLPLQWVALIIACVLVAGLCIAIISWDDENEAEAPAATEETPNNPQ